MVGRIFMNKRNVLTAYILALSSFALISIFLSFQQIQLDILPLIIDVKNHAKPARTPETFAENYSDTASQAALTYYGNTSFAFKYRKSSKQSHPFSGVFFPLENLSINFSQYDAVEIGIQAKKARRIPFNLSVQNKKYTHQYVRQFIEIKKGKTLYSLRLSDFYTPASWYNRNNLAQVDIPDPDFSKIEALSFESCHLLATGVQDEFEVNHLVLTKEQNWIYVMLALFLGLSFTFAGIWFFYPFEIKKEVIHVPVKQVEFESKGSVEEDIILYLGGHYTNPNLTLSDLTKEFGINNREISNIIKTKTAMTFPKYLSFLRVEEAKRLLASKNYKTISEVGYAVGFNSPSNFNRVFKNMVGTSPKQFQ